MKNGGSPPLGGRCVLSAAGGVILLILSVTMGATEAAAAAPRASNPTGATRTDGATLYAKHCSRCHGPSGQGDGPDAGLFVTPPRNLRSGFLGHYSTAELTSRVRDGMRLSLALDPAAVRAHATDTEAIARYVERLPAINWRIAERGEEVFVDRCEICHGPFGRPSGPRPPGVGQPRDLSASDFQARAHDEGIARTIREGHGSMPGLVPRVPVADVPALVAFVRLLSPGFEGYTRYCAACHGDDGRGSGVRYGDDGAPVPTVVLDRAYLKHHDFEHVRAAVWHMLDEHRPEMPHLRATLSEADAHAIVEYLKSVEADTR